MKSKGYIMALMAMAAMSEGTIQPERGNQFIPDTEEDKRRAQERQRELLKKKGVKEFTIYGRTVIARDYANALRKIANLSKVKN